MAYNFEEFSDRSKTASHKWQAMKESTPNVADGVVPLSVADMEFQIAPEIIEGLKSYLNEDIFGYEGPRDSFNDAVINWHSRRHNWNIDKNWIVTTPGVVLAINLVVKAYTDPNDGIIIFTPVYGPFEQAVNNNKRHVIRVPLIETDNYYTIDLELFERVAKEPNNKLLLLSSPHNPVGRVWTREELEKIADIARENDLVVFSDEVWNDLILFNNEHKVLANLNNDIANRTITAHAASKTFNLAGMHTSTIIIPNDELRLSFQEVLAEQHASINNLGYKATELAYNKGEAWLDELIKVIETNQKSSHDFFKEKLPEISAPISEGTYLQWLDFRALNLSPEALQSFLNNNAQIFFSEGYTFGEEGAGFARMNLALPTEVLQESLDRLYVAIKEQLS